MTTEQAAKAVRITRATLQAWITKGKFKAPEVRLRNGRAVRLWTAEDIRKLREAKRRLYRKEMGRPPKKERIQ
jgi:excisionase family DNA binding protein